MPTEQEIHELKDAMWQLLDDMSGSLSVCLFAKAKARVAFEPFRDDDFPECAGWITLEEAKAILKQCE